MARLPSVVAAPSVKPIADNNFILATAPRDAMRQHVSSNRGSPFGQESVYRIGANDAIPRRHIPAESGIQAHFEFAKRVRALSIPGIRTAGVEQSFDLGAVVRYGLDGSVRTDIVLRDRSGIPIAVYDLKTGNAKLTPSRVQELRNAVGRQDIPVIELRYVSESAILR